MSRRRDIGFSRPGNLTARSIAGRSLWLREIAACVPGTTFSWQSAGRPIRLQRSGPGAAGAAELTQARPTWPVLTRSFAQDSNPAADSNPAVDSFQESGVAWPGGPLLDGLGGSLQSSHDPWRGPSSGATGAKTLGRQFPKGEAAARADTRAPGARRPAPLADFDRSVEVTKSGLIFQRPLAFRAWEAIGRQLLEVVDSSSWWVGDWLLYGETNFQDRYAEAIVMTALNYQTLRNYAWVARCFDLDRRQSGLSFGHHAEVAALDRPEQDFWLRKAVEFGWSRNRLRAEVRASIKERQAGKTGAVCEAPHEEDPGSEEPDAPLQGEPCEASISLQLTGDQLLRFTAAAESIGLEVHEWVIAVLESAFEGCEVKSAFYRRIQ